MIRPIATKADYEMYNRYVTHFHSGRSPYGGTVPLPFDQWMALKPQHRPGGPETPVLPQPTRSAHTTWTENDIVWEK